MTNQQTVLTCACGCGETFPFDPSHPTKKYVNRDHLLKAGGRDPKVEVKALKAQLKEAEKREKLLVASVDDMRRTLDRYSFVRAEDRKVPEWLTPKRLNSKEHHATGVLLLSDLHLDEVVDLEAMDGMNEYDRAIAHLRLERVVESTVKLLSTYVSGVHIDNLVAAMIGDIITGWIHAELERTNEAPVPATIAHWVPHLASALVYLADTLDVRIYVPWVDGNHDRAYGKPQMKQRAQSSFSWIIANWLADHLRHDNRIQFGITTSPEQIVPVYDTRFLLNHGDQFRSYGGVGGLYPAMLKWLLRKHDLYSQTKQDFDYALLGHWHQPLWGQDFVVNGSLKGYDEYAKHGGFKFNKPSQQLFIVTPERGITQRIEVFAE